MSLEAAWTLIVIFLSLVGLAREYLSPDILLLGALGLLVLTGVVDLDTAMDGFANPTLLAIGSLFVVSAGLRQTGVLDRAADRLLGASGNLRRTILRLSGITGLASAFMNNTPVVAMGMPAVVRWARDRDISPSKLLIPLSYASILGGTCTLLGTSTNLVADGLLKSHGLAGLGFFELAAVGGPVLLVGTAYLVLVAPDLLPERRDPRETAQREEDRLVEMEVEASSPLVGRSLREAEEAGLGEVAGGEFVRAERSAPAAAVPLRRAEEFRGGDRVTFRGVEEEVHRKGGRLGMHPVEEAEDGAPEAAAEEEEGPESAWEEEVELREAVIPEGSPLVRESVEETNFRNRYRANVTGVIRNGRYLMGPLPKIELRAGDCLLLEGSPGFTEAFQDVGDFVLVERVEEVEEEDERKRPERPVVAVFILASVVVLTVAGIMDIALASLFGGIAMLVLGLLTPAEARRSVDWSVLIVIGAALGLASAVEASGAAAVVGQALVEVGGELGPLGILGATVVATMLFTAVITNNAVVALMIPIGLAAASSQGLAPRPFIIGVTVSASISFLTPLGYQTNLMVYGPGGYRFGDFFRVGLPLQLAAAVVVVLVIPVVWPL